MKRRIKFWLNQKLSRWYSHQLEHEALIPNNHWVAWNMLRCKGVDLQNIMDIGAAQGEWTREILLYYKTANYLLVDPLDENKIFLEKLANEHGNVQYWMGVCGRENGRLDINVHGDQTSILSSKEWDVHVKRTVQMKKLDDLVQEKMSGVVDGLKIDVQGAELEVLTGAIKTLSTCKIIQVEVSFRRVYEGMPLAHEIIVFFASHGFRIFDITNFYKRKDHVPLQADLFFTSDDNLCIPESWYV